MGFVVCMAGYLFYQNDYEKPSILLAIISALLKHSWGVIIGSGILCTLYRYGEFSKLNNLISLNNFKIFTGWFMVDVFNYPGFRILGRISFSAFMCHLFFIKLHMAGIHQPMYLSYYIIVGYKFL